MANIQIPNLGQAIYLDGTELLEVVQSGTSKKITTFQILTYIGGGAGAPYWQVPQGGTGVGTLAQYGLVYGNGVNPVGVTGAGSTGQIFIGNTSAAPSWTSSPSISGSLTTPIVYGGTGSGSTLTLQSTSGIGSSDAILFNTGAGVERMRVDTTGSVGIGATSVTGYDVRVSKNITGASTARGIAVDGTIQSDVTAAGYVFDTGINTAAASFTVPSLGHYHASQGTFGAGSVVTSQFGFHSAANLIGAVSNYGFFADNTAAVTTGKTAYGFYSAVNTATGGGTAWSLYSAGTANSAIAGKLRIGSTVAPVATLDITGTIAVSGGITGPAIITATSANAFAVGQAGITNPAFNVDTSTASSATGINIKSAAAGAGVALSTISSGTNENLKIDAKGSGTITLGGTSTGDIVTPRSLSIGSISTPVTSPLYVLGGTGLTTFVANIISQSTAPGGTGGINSALRVDAGANVGNIAVFTANNAGGTGPVQVAVTNTNGSNGAGAVFIAANDTNADVNGMPSFAGPYLEMGVNSSGTLGGDFFGLPNGAYILSEGNGVQTQSLTLGTNASNAPLYIAYAATAAWGIGGAGQLAFNQNYIATGAGGSASVTTPGGTLTSVTCSVANPGVVTWAGNTLNLNDPIYFNASAYPGGLYGAQVYFVKSILVAGSTFTVSQYVGGDAIQFTSTGISVQAAKAPIITFNVTNSYAQNSLVYVTGYSTTGFNTKDAPNSFDPYIVISSTGTAFTAAVPGALSGAATGTGSFSAVTPAIYGTNGLSTIVSGGTNKTPFWGSINNLFGYATTNLTGGTLTLTNASPYIQYITGTTGNVQLPLTNTLSAGAGTSYHIANNATGNILIYAGPGLSNLVATLIPNTTVHITALNATGGGLATDWDYGYTDFGGITGTGNVVMSNTPTLTTPVLSGATNWGSVYINGSGQITSTATGTTGQPLLANSATGPAFGNLNLGTANTNVTGALTVTNGGTGAATLTLNGVLYGNGTNAVQVTAQGAANTILTANAGAPSFSATPTIGTSVTVPLVSGGNATSSVLSLQSTSAAGATDAVKVITGTQVEMHRFDQNGMEFTTQPTPFNSNTAVTLTNANLQTRIITSTPTANINHQMPLGTTLETLNVGGGTLFTNAAFDFSIISLAAFTVGLSTNTGVTLVGNMTVAANSSGTFRVRRTAANTFTVYRIT